MRVPRMLQLLFLFVFTCIGCVVHEGRGIWVVRYRLTSPAVVDQVVEDARAGRFNLLFVQVHGRGDAYYHSVIDPRAETLIDAPAGYDPLRYVLDRGHEAGLQVHAWVNAFYVWPYPPPYPLSEKHIVISEPDWLIVDDEGRNLAQYNPYQRAREPVEGLYLDPASAEVSNYVLQVCKEVVTNYDVDGIHLDFIRYPGQRWGFNEGAVKAFVERWGVDPRLLSGGVRNPNPERFLRKDLPLHLRWHYYYYSLWTETKSYYITDLVRDIQEAVKSIKPSIVLSAAVFPDAKVAQYSKGQDWATWLTHGYIDLVVPMAYYGDSSRVTAQMAEARKRGGEQMVFAGLGAWRKDPAQIQQEVQRLRDLGIPGFSYFSYQGMKERDAEYIAEIQETLHRRRASVRRLEERQSNVGSSMLPPWEEHGVDVLLRSLQKQSYSLDDYESLLSRLGLTQGDLRELLMEDVEIFSGFTQRVYPYAQPPPEEIVVLPSSVDVQAIFRYVHPMDSPETRREAYMTIQEAYRRVSDGEDFAEVARQLSQGVTAGLGGVQDRVYLQDGWDLDKVVFSLQEGDITPVIEIPNGYIIYKVVKCHPPETRPYGDLPWALKRVVFQKRFAALVELESAGRLENHPSSLSLGMEQSALP